MKTVLALLALVAVAFAQHHGHNALDALVAHEVNAILGANAGISVDDCTAKCDAMFDLIDDKDESHTDMMCHHYCDCEMNKTCAHHNHQAPTGNPTTKQPHQTHPPHPTHPPHHTHPPHPTK